MKYSTRQAALSAILAAYGVFQTASFAGTSYSAVGTNLNWASNATWNPNTGYPGSVGTTDQAHLGAASAGAGVTLNSTVAIDVLAPAFTAVLNITSGGSLTLDSGSTFFVSSGAHLNLSSGGTLIQNGTNSSFRVDGANGGPATINQTGGSLTTAAAATIGSNQPTPTDTGTYNISGGTATFSQALRVGNTSTSSFNQTGGAVNAAVTTLNGLGTYKISGGSFTTTSLTVNTNSQSDKFSVIGSAATSITITGTGSTAFDLTTGVGVGTLAFQIDGGGITEIIDSGGATINANSLLDLGWANGATFSAGHVFNLLQATSFTGTSNLHLASNPQDSNFTFAVVGNVLQATLISSIPEPATLGIFAIGATALLARRRRACA